MWRELRNRVYVCGSFHLRFSVPPARREVTLCKGHAVMQLESVGLRDTLTGQSSGDIRTKGSVAA